jgi:hypothetical protein
MENGRGPGRAGPGIAGPGLAGWPGLALRAGRLAGLGGLD